MAGLCVLGLTVYGFLTVCARALGPDRYSALSALWALVFLAGPGVFFPVEQEVSKAVTARLAAGTGARPVVQRAGVAAALLATALALVFGAAGPALVRDVFDGQVLVLAGLVLSLFGYAALHLARGVLSGSGRFGAYGVLLGAEGALRLTAAAAMLAAGVRTAGPLALVVGLAPFAAVALTIRSQRGLLDVGPPAPWSELTRSLGFLLLASLLAQILIHSGPLAVKLLGPGDSKELTARFFAGVLLTRMPLFLFFAVQAALLPRLTGFVVRRDRDGFSRSLARLVTIVATLGILSIGGAFIVGQQAITLFFGSRFLLDDRGLALLAASTAAIMVAQALGQALVALDGQRVAATCWLAGVVAFVTITALGEDPLLRVELGLVGGSCVAAAAMAIALPSRLGGSFEH